MEEMESRLPPQRSGKKLPAYDPITIPIIIIVFSIFYKSWRGGIPSPRLVRLWRRTDDGTPA
jgi:hypothetical protein